MTGNPHAASGVLRGQFLCYLVNQGFIWLLVKQMGGPTWWPTIPIIFVTPLLTFALHRRFVYS